MKPILTPFLFIAFFSLSLQAQTIGEQYEFAQTYFGIDLLTAPAYQDGIFLNEEGGQEPFNRSAFLTPAINFGGLHFWGFADIYISITTQARNLGDQAVGTEVDYGVFTGFRLYPWRLQRNSIRPYAGYKFSPIRYRQENLEGEKAVTTQVRSILDLGIGYRSAKWYTYLAYNWLPNTNTSIPLDRETIFPSSLPKGFFNIGINYSFDATEGSDSPSSLYFGERFDKVNEKGWYFGIGPSSAFPTKNSSYLEVYYPFLDQRAMPLLFPDISGGYHFTHSNWLINLAFRPITQKREAFDFEQRVRRNALSLEAVKELFDYNGFVPFLGAGVSWEHLRMQEKDEGIEITDIREQQFSPILTFGWDIRSRSQADPWLLRTNLRWSPFLKLEHRGESLSLQQLEFNFIQLIIYPQRIKSYKNY